MNNRFTPKSGGISTRRKNSGSSDTISVAGNKPGFSWRDGMESSKGQQLERMLDDLFSDVATYRENPLYKPTRIVNLLPEEYRPDISDEYALPRDKVVDILQEIILHRLTDQLITGKKHNVSIGYFYLLHKYFYTEKLSPLIRSSKDGLFNICLESTDIQTQFLEKHLLPLAEKKSNNKGKVDSRFKRMIVKSKSRNVRTQYNSYSRVLEELADELASVIPDLFTYEQTKVTDVKAGDGDGKNESPKNELKSGEIKSATDVSEMAKQVRQNEAKAKNEAPRKDELAEILRNLLEYELGLTEYLPIRHPTPLRGESHVCKGVDECFCLPQDELHPCRGKGRRSFILQSKKPPL